MDSNDLVREIKDVNLAYLLLVQRLMRQDEAEALLRLGIRKEIGQALVALTPAQMLALARSSMVLCRFRLDNGALLEALAGIRPRHELCNMHTAIVLAAQALEEGR
ncbi:Flagellar transcriptional regulator FlhD [Cupriavidus laharis]|uniref:Flagellar transcriptional regulator FlhD n=1 Tax=Cupriavidus laharis TaxID=151654 RepID=A0ABN7ZEQ0_9BURK|nr:flagellar transcriptional regulator FlhD [Cupriavidus laharis]CAG9182776.1 Flagellar transcriptional regulator FlhD [Cupriavidus laharis]